MIRQLMCYGEDSEISNTIQKYLFREAVSRRGPIKLTVAKSFENGAQSCFTIPRNSREEPVRPIDTQAWIQHTNAMRGMPSIVEGIQSSNVVSILNLSCSRKRTNPNPWRVAPWTASEQLNSHFQRFQRTEYCSYRWSAHSSRHSH